MANNTVASEATAKIAGNNNSWHYKLTGKILSAHLLLPKEFVFLQHPKCPEQSRNKNPSQSLLVQGTHFDFEPPQRGRDEITSNWRPSIRDTSFCAKFTAKVPLLVCMHGAWDNRGNKLQGGQSIGHFRMARSESDTGFGITRELMQLDPEIFQSDHRLMYGCKNLYSEHLCLGGPLASVIYRDEIVIPGYHWRPEYEAGAPSYTYIVEKHLLDLVKHNFKQGSAEMRATREGKAPVIAYAVSGALQTVQLGPVTVQFDRVGRIHTLYERRSNGAVVPTTKATLDPTGGKRFVLCIGTMVIDPIVRQYLRLDEPTVEVGPVQTPAQTLAPLLEPLEARLAMPAAQDILPPLEDGWEVFVEGVLAQEEDVTLPRILAIDGQVIAPRGAIMDLGVCRRIVSAYAVEDIRLTPESAPLLDRLNALYQAWSEEEVEEEEVEGATEIAVEAVVETPAPVIAEVKIVAPAATVEASVTWDKPANPIRQTFNDLPKVMKAATLAEIGLNPDQQVLLEMVMDQMGALPVPRIMTLEGQLLLEVSEQSDVYSLAGFIKCLDTVNVMIEPAMADWFAKFNALYLELNPETNPDKVVLYRDEE